MRLASGFIRRIEMQTLVKSETRLPLEAFSTRGITAYKRLISGVHAFMRLEVELFTERLSTADDVTHVCGGGGAFLVDWRHHGWHCRKSWNR